MQLGDKEGKTKGTVTQGGATVQQTPKDAPSIRRVQDSISSTRRCAVEEHARHYSLSCSHEKTG